MDDARKTKDSVESKPDVPMREMAKSEEDFDSIDDEPRQSLHTQQQHQYPVAHKMLSYLTEWMNQREEPGVCVVVISR